MGQRFFLRLFVVAAAFVAGAPARHRAHGNHHFPSLELNQPTEQRQYERGEAPDENGNYKSGESVDEDTTVEDKKPSEKKDDTPEEVCSNPAHASICPCHVR